jgi:hypothetical protein
MVIRNYELLLNVGFGFFTLLEHEFSSNSSFPNIINLVYNGLEM